MAPATFQQLGQLYTVLGGNVLTKEGFDRILGNGDLLRAIANGSITRREVTPLLETVRFCGLLIHYGASEFAQLCKHWSERHEWFIQVDGRPVRMSDHYGEFTQEQLRSHWSQDYPHWRIRATGPCRCVPAT